MAEPTRIGKYEVLKFLGKGSAGQVYKAFDPVIDRFVAIKVIRAEALSQPGQMDRFRKEVRAHGKVLHPNVAVIFDVECIEGQYVIVMEYVPGGTLRDLLKRERIVTLRQFYVLVKQICDGLGYAHQQGVIHRDIKPENIALTELGRVKIMDFSIAKLHSAPPTLSSGNFLLGTVDYMSPEQILGQPVSPASDQFSLGIVCFEMLTGTRPFHGQTVADTILNITRKDPPRIHDLNPMAEPEMDAIVGQLLAKDPLQRYPSLLHFRKRLKEHLHNMHPKLVMDETGENMYH